jgi:hypothetical protein
MKTFVPVTAGALAFFIGSASIAAERIQLVERALTDTTTDLGAKGDSVGDLMTWLNPLYDAADKVQLGTDQGFCIRVAVGKSWECNWTNILKDGRITVEGAFADTGDSVLTVTGGTGKYAGAKGQLKLHPRDAKGSAYDFAFDLL